MSRRLRFKTRLEPVGLEGGGDDRLGGGRRRAGTEPRRKRRHQRRRDGRRRKRRALNVQRLDPERAVVLQRDRISGRLRQLPDFAGVRLPGFRGQGRMREQLLLNRLENRFWSLVEENLGRVCDGRSVFVD